MGRLKKEKFTEHTEHTEHTEPVYSKGFLIVSFPVIVYGKQVTEVFKGGSFPLVMHYTPLKNFYALVSLTCYPCLL